MTQEQKTHAAREVFYKAIDTAKISLEDYQAIAAAATKWASFSYSEGIDAARSSRYYTPVMTATHDGTATIVEPVAP